MCWGANGYGQLGRYMYSLQQASFVGIPGLESGVAEVGVGIGFACARTTAGAVYCWGDNPNGELGNGRMTTSAPADVAPGRVIGLESGVTALSVGSSHACVIQNGGVKCWGDNTQGQIGDGTAGTGYDRHLRG